MAGLSIYCERQGSVLVPINFAAEDDLHLVRERKPVRVTIVRERAARQNGFFWVLCEKIARGLRAMGDDQATKDNVADRLKIATGHCTLAKLSYKHRIETGQEYAVQPKSIDFNSMDHHQFSQWVDKVVGFVVTDLLPHIPLHSVRCDIHSLLDDDLRRAYLDGKRARVAA